MATQLWRHKEATAQRQIPGALLEILQIRQQTLRPLVTLLFIFAQCFVHYSL